MRPKKIKGARVELKARKSGADHGFVRPPPSSPRSSVVVVRLLSVGRAASSRLPPEIRHSVDNAGEKMPAHPPLRGGTQARVGLAGWGRKEAKSARGAAFFPEWSV
jgi:hypothetical protein